MYIIDDYLTAVLFCIITMFCWGSWANTQKIASSSWRFELFYWDYVNGILFLSILLAFTLGSFGGQGRSFISDVGQAHHKYLLSAVLGVIIFNAANIILVAAIAVAGMSVAFPIGIGLALVIGVISNFVINPVGDRFTIIRWRRTYITSYSIKCLLL